MRSTPGARAPRPPDQDEAEKIILARAEKILGRKITTAEINRLRDGTLRLHGTELREYDRRGRRIAAHTAEDSAAVWQTTDRDPDTPTSGRAVLVSTHARTRVAHQRPRERRGHRRSTRTAASRADSDDGPSSEPPPWPKPPRELGSPGRVIAHTRRGREGRWL